MARYDGDERRVPQELGWHLDKKVPLSLIAAMIAQVIVVVMFFADLKRDVELLKADVQVLHERDKTQEDDFKAAIVILQQHYARMDAKLDRLIERAMK